MIMIMFIILSYRIADGIRRSLPRLMEYTALLVKGFV